MCERQKISAVQTNIFVRLASFCVISTETGNYNRPILEKERGKHGMKEVLFEIGTWMLATIQAAWLVWVSGVFVH